MVETCRTVHVFSEDAAVVEAPAVAATAHGHCHRTNSELSDEFAQVTRDLTTEDRVVELGAVWVVLAGSLFRYVRVLCVCHRAVGLPVVPREGSPAAVTASRVWGAVDDLLLG